MLGYGGDVRQASCCVLSAVTVEFRPVTATAPVAGQTAEERIEERRSYISLSGLLVWHTTVFALAAWLVRSEAICALTTRSIPITAADSAV